MFCGDAFERRSGLSAWRAYLYFHLSRAEWLVFWSVAPLRCLDRRAHDGSQLVRVVLLVRDRDNTARLHIRYASAWIVVAFTLQDVCTGCYASALEQRRMRGAGVFDVARTTQSAVGVCCFVRLENVHT